MDGDLGGRSRDRGATGAVAKLRTALGGLAEVRGPDEAEEPVLAPNARRAVFEWLSEINARDQLKAVGLKPRTSAMLYGPPGTGKTTLAHHLAVRLGVPIVLVGAENLKAKFVGESEGNTARLFDAIGASGVGCVLFLDEIDAIGSKRGSAEDASDKLANSMVTVLLRKVEAHKGILIAATNRREVLDPALWRRFHMQISVDLPGDDERFAILKRYGAPFVWDEDDLGILCDLTEGASPALLRGLMEGAKRSIVLAKRQNRDVTDPVVVFGGILAGLEPPEGVAKPVLWDRAAGLPDLARFKAWPPVLGSDA